MSLSLLVYSSHFLCLSDSVYITLSPHKSFYLSYSPSQSYLLYLSFCLTLCIPFFFLSLTLHLCKKTRNILTTVPCVYSWPKNWEKKGHSRDWASFWGTSAYALFVRPFLYFYHIYEPLLYCAFVDLLFYHHWRAGRKLELLIL